MELKEREKKKKPFKYALVIVTFLSKSYSYHISSGERSNNNSPCNKRKFVS